MRVVLKFATAAAIVVLLVAGLAACGGEDESATTGQSAPAGEAASSGGSGSESGGKANGAGKQGSGSGGQGAGSDRQAGSETDSQGSDSNGSDSAPATTGTSAAVRRAAAKAFRKFGVEVGDEERTEAITAFEDFLAARADGDWAKVCSALTAKLREGVQKLAQLSKRVEAKDCESIFKTLAAAQPDSLQLDLAQITVGSVRVEDGRAVIRFRDGKGETSFFSLAREGGEWKVASFGPTPFPQIPQ